MLNFKKIVVLQNFANLKKKFFLIFFNLKKIVIWENNNNLQIYLFLKILWLCKRSNFNNFHKKYFQILKIDPKFFNKLIHFCKTAISNNI